MVSTLSPRTVVLGMAHGAGALPSAGAAEEHMEYDTHVHAHIHLKGGNNEKWPIEIFLRVKSWKKGYHNFV